MNWWWLLAIPPALAFATLDAWLWGRMMRRMMTMPDLPAVLPPPVA